MPENGLVTQKQVSAGLKLTVNSLEVAGQASALTADTDQSKMTVTSPNQISEGAINSDDETSSSSEKGVRQTEQDVGAAASTVYIAESPLL